MKILLINKFLYPKGGDAICALTTGALLMSKGHQVLFWGMEHPDNPQYSTSSYFIDFVDYERPAGLKGQIKVAARLLYSLEAKNKVEKLIRAERPNVIHLNNFAHQISPSILDIFAKYEIPTVMTVHDYKLVCPVYTMLFNNSPCEKCKGGRYYWCLFGKCTKGSYAKSLLNTVEMYLHHKILHSYNKVGIFISPSHFLMNKIEEMGFREKLIYLPNFVNTDEFVPSYDYYEKAIYYAGRLSEEKGLFALVEAVKGLDVKLIIIGDGPLREELEKRKGDNTLFMGYISQQELKRQAKKCMAMVIPSEWYENNPRSVIEAFALGKPVIGARIGGIPELVHDGWTGFTFEPGDADDLREKVKQLISMPSSQVRAMGEAARTFVEENFNQERHYQGVMEIYHMAMQKYS